MLVLSASHPKNAEPMPPRPSMRPKITPEIIPILSGIRSVAYISTDGAPHTVWADFDENDDQYFGIPFWAAGHNGRAGLDQIYKHLNRKELEDFKAWLRYLCDK